MISLCTVICCSIVEKALHGAKIDVHVTHQHIERAEGEISVALTPFGYDHPLHFKVTMCIVRLHP